MSSEESANLPASTPARTESGQFVAGVSGNPLGRPKNSKNRALELQRKLEVAVRESISVETVKDIVEKLCQRAKNGDNKAAKLILDKLIPNAAPGTDDDADREHTIVFRIENATFAASAAKHSVIEVTEAEIVNGKEQAADPSIR